MNTYLALWNICPTVKQIKSTFKSKIFLLTYLCIFLLFVLHQYNDLRTTIKNDFFLINEAFENFVKQKTTTMTYAGIKIINNKILCEKFISTFLNDLQNINIFSGRDLSFSESSLIWITKELVPVGAFGRLNQNIYQPNQDFINNCQNSASIIFSMPYKSLSFANTEFMDICLMFKKNNKHFGFLIMHYNLEEIIKNIIPIHLIEKYQIKLVFDNTQTVIKTLPKSSNNILNDIDDFILKKSLNAMQAKADKKFYHHSIKNIPHAFLNINIQLPNIFTAFLKHAFFILLFNFSLIFIYFSIKNYAFLTTQKMLYILNQINKNPKKDKINLRIEKNKNLLENFKSAVKYIKKLASELHDKKNYIFIQQNLMLEKVEENKELEESLKEQHKLLNLVEYYFTENIKFKKIIGKHLYTIIFNTIRETHNVLQNDITLEKRMQVINTNLKNILSGNFESKKELLDPGVLINEVISAIMIYAIFRNIEIKINIKGVMDKIYLKKQKFQMIMVGLIFQSIDATPKDGKILISCEKIIIHKKEFLTITIEDDS